MNFVKMHGLGNDFILIDDREEKIDLTPKEVSRICHRYFGVGADGLILIRPSTKYNIKMIFYNQDGTEAAMCGNGIRCFAKYVYKKRIVQQKKIDIETKAGKISVKIIQKENNSEMVQVNMGIPDYNPIHIPVNIDKKMVLDETIFINGKKVIFSSVLMGVPHTIIEVDNLVNYPVKIIGSAIENHPLFPDKTNVNFVEITNHKEIHMLTWERGVGITLACGTGACAVAAILKKQKKIDDSVSIYLPGGTLEINFIDENILMTGPVEEVFVGTLSI